MLKTKYALSALGLLVAMTMATDALAQGIFTVSSSIEPRARMNSHTEMAGGITLKVEVESEGSDFEADSGTLTIEYGAPITNFEKGDNAIIVTGTGCFIDANVGDAIVDEGILTISIGMLDASTTTCGNNNSIDIDGVLLALAGSGLSEVSASISVSGDFRLERSQVTVINTVVDELDDEDVTTVFEVGDKDVDHKLTLLRHTGEVASGKAAKFVLKITENTVDSFDEAELILNFSGIPEGFSIKLDAWVSEVGEDPVLADRISQGDNPATTGENQVEMTFDRSNDEVSIDTPVTDDENEATVSMALIVNEEEDELGGMLTSSKRDVVTVRGEITFDEDEVTLPLVGDIEITLTVDVGPTGVANPRGSAYMGVPRFESDKSAPVTVVAVTSDKTTLLIPFAIYDGLMGGYDTGIAVSNRNTKDEQEGTIMFAFWMDGDMIEFETGTLQAGGAFVSLLSEMLDAAGHTGNFSGYVVITTNFTNADGAAYILDGTTGFSAGATMTTLP
jgi:hypothetical protein